jgi:hypothetical protein
MNEVDTIGGGLDPTDGVRALTPSYALKKTIGRGLKKKALGQRRQLKVIEFGVPGTPSLASRLELEGHDFLKVQR